MEEWRDIVGFPYRISSFGKVLNKNTGKEKRLNIRNGYAYVQLWKNNKKKLISVHRLVAIAFLGLRRGLVVCHNNGNKLDNRLINLRWDTQKNNVKDREVHRTVPIGSKHTNSKIKESDVLEIRILLGNKASHKYIAKKFNISKSNVSAIATGRSWGWL